MKLREHDILLHPHLQVSKMGRIIPYQLPTDGPTIRELMEGRPAGADERGIPPAGLPRHPPLSAYREEDRMAARRRAWAWQIEPWRGERQQR